jgi:hypothetical protein
MLLRIYQASLPFISALSIQAISPVQWGTLHFILQQLARCRRKVNRRSSKPKSERVKENLNKMREKNSLSLTVKKTLSLFISHFTCNRLTANSICNLCFKTAQHFKVAKVQRVQKKTKKSCFL